MMTFIRHAAAGLLLASFSLFSHAQTTHTMKEVAENVVSRLKTQITSFPQEKIYLHLDKPYYAVGDLVWFRAHVVNAALGLPYNLSRYVYVELIDSYNKVITRVKVRPLDGMYYGQLSLSTDLTEGLYSIRAYTNYMRNVGEPFFYRRSIYIGNPLKEKKTELKDTYSKPAGSDTINPYTLTFFPEGGQLLPGNLQTIGIKAIRDDGAPANVFGKLVDAANNEIAQFNTVSGIASVYFVPEEDQLYKALCEDDKGNAHTISLPSVSPHAYSLSVVQNQTSIGIRLLTANNASPEDSLLLVIHQRGVPLLQDFFTTDIKEMGVSKKGISPGMLQFVLIDREYRILSERQLFIQQQNPVHVTVTTDKPSYRKRERVTATIQLSDASGNPIKGNFSISITDDDDVTYDENDETIESRLLLQADLSEALNKPGQYFRKDNRQAAAELDLLMLTSPWKRYEVASAVKGLLPKGGLFPVERGSSISGQLVSYPSKRGLAGTQVSLFIQNSNHIDARTTDKNGRFQFDGFEFPDSTKIMLEAKLSSTNFARLLVDNDSFPDVSLSMPAVFDYTASNPLKRHLEKSRERYYQEFGVRTIDLQEVEVVARRQEQDKLQQFRLDRGALYFNPTQTIKEDKLETAHTIIDLLITVPGISVSADGRSVSLYNKTPQIMIDNIRSDMNELTSLFPSDVELIDIIKDPTDLAYYGLYGSSGIIFVHMKRGEKLVYSKEPEANQAIVQPLGFSKPLPFPEPNYSRPEARLNNFPDVRSTLYWKPNVVCDENGNATVGFFLGDGQGPCTITIEGVGPDGRIIRYQGKINAGK